MIGAHARTNARKGTDQAVMASAAGRGFGDQETNRWSCRRRTSAPQDCSPGMKAGNDLVAHGAWSLLPVPQATRHTQIPHGDQTTRSCRSHARQPASDSQRRSAEFPRAHRRAVSPADQPPTTTYGSSAGLTSPPAVLSQRALPRAPTSAQRRCPFPQAARRNRAISRRTGTASWPSRVMAASACRGLPLEGRHQMGIYFLVSAVSHCVSGHAVYSNALRRHVGEKAGSIAVGRFGPQRKYGQGRVF
jgi:hypothetical protein